MKQPKIKIIEYGEIRFDGHDLWMHNWCLSTNLPMNLRRAFLAMAREIGKNPDIDFHLNFSEVKDPDAIQEVKT